MPKVGIDTSEDAMPIELGNPLIAKCNFWQILKSTKFSEAPESTKIWTGKLSNRPSTTAGLRLEGALARYGFSTDETETTALEGADLYPVFDWHTRAKCPGLPQMKQVASWAGQNWPPQKEHREVNCTNITWIFAINLALSMLHPIRFSVWRKETSKCALHLHSRLRLQRKDRH